MVLLNLCMATPKSASIKISSVIFHNIPAELIVHTIKFISPIYLMYFELLDPSFAFYNRMLPAEHFNMPSDNEQIKHVIAELIRIGSYLLLNKYTMNFQAFVHTTRMDWVNHQSLVGINDEIKKQKERKFLITEKHFSGLIYDTEMECIKNENLHMAKCISKVCGDNIIIRCVVTNNFEVFEQLVMYKISINSPISQEASDHILKLTVKNSACVRFISRYLDFILENPKFFVVNCASVFFNSLIHGSPHVMMKLIELSKHTFDNLIWQMPRHNGESIQTTENKLWIEYNWDHENDFLNYADSIIYAIRGKNLYCVHIMFLEMFKIKTTTINTHILEKYIMFAASDGTLEILQYIINTVPNIESNIVNLYHKILLFAMLNANKEIVMFAKNKGAVLIAEQVKQYVENYNTAYRDNMPFMNNLSHIFHQYREEYINEYQSKFNECLALIST